MDKDERRAFKLFATTYERKENLTLMLFDIVYDHTHRLSAGESIIEKEMMQRIKNSDLSSQYTSVKNRLKNLIMDFLYERNRKDDEIEQIHRKLCVANLMLNKGYQDTGIQMLLEAKKTAVEYEDFDNWLCCAQIELYSLSNNGVYTLEVQQALLHEINQVLSLLARFAAAIHDTNMVRDSHLKRAPLPAGISTIETLIEKIQGENSVKIKNQYYLTLAALSMKRDKPEVTTGYVAAHIKMLEDNIKPNAHYIIRYFVAFGPYMLVLGSANDAATYHAQVQKLEAKFVLYKQYLDPGAIAFVQLNIYKYKLGYCRIIHQRQAMAEVVNEAEVCFLKHYKMITEEGLSLYKSLLRNSFFFAGNYAKAEEWATNDLGRAILPPPVVLAGFIIELICGYELAHDLEAMRAKVKRIRYYMMTKVQATHITGFMNDMIEMALHLINSRNADETHSSIRQIQQKCKEVMKINDDPLAAIVRNSYIEYWLETKA